VTNQTPSKGTIMKNTITATRVAAIAAAVFTFGMAGVAQAEETRVKGPYVGFKFGLNEPEDQQFTAGGEVTPVAQAPIVVELPRSPNDGPSSLYRYDRDPAYALTVGYMFGSGLRPEFELSYRQDEPDSITNSSGGAELAIGKISVSTAFGNLWYDFFPSWNIRPYIGGGIGFARAKLDAFQQDNIGPLQRLEPVGGGAEAPRQGEDSRFAYQLGAGVNWDFYKNFTLGLDYRYLKTQEYEFFVFQRQQFASFDAEYETQTLFLSLNYYFAQKEPTPPAPPPEPVVVPVSDSDGDGVNDDADQCPNTPRGTEVDSVGCPIPPPPPACGEAVNGSGAVSLEGCSVGDRIVLRGVNFDTNKSNLTVNARTLLDDVAADLQRFPDVTVEVSGHTDNVGSAAYNEGLSQRRADSVKAYLESKGIAADRLTTRGYGLTQPTADNDTVEGRELNRRVELEVTGGSAVAGAERAAPRAAPAPTPAAAPTTVEDEAPAAADPAPAPSPATDSGNSTDEDLDALFDF